MNRHKYPEEYLSPAVSKYYLNIMREVESWLEKNTRPSGRYKHFKKVTFSLTMEQLSMARKRGVSTRGNTNNKVGGASGSSGGAVKWCNVRLDDTDAAYLAENPAGLPELAAMACELVTLGYSLTIKPLDGGESVMACIIGACSTHPDITAGVSGFSDNPRDALLTVLYKFDSKLGGELPLPDVDVSTVRPKFR